MYPRVRYIYPSYKIKGGHLFRVELLPPIAWHVFRQSKSLEASLNCCLDHIFEGSFGVATELA